MLPTPRLHVGPVRVRRRPSYAAAHRDLTRLMDHGTGVALTQEALVTILADGLRQTTTSGELLGLIVTAPQPVSTRMLSRQCGSHINVTQELAKRLMHPDYPLVLRRSFLRRQGGREFRYLPTDLGCAVWQRLAPATHRVVAAKAVSQKRVREPIPPGFSAERALTQHTWRMAMDHYRRLRADADSWPFNERSAARMLREALPRTPRLWMIMQALATSGRPVTTGELYETYRMYGRHGRQEALVHLGTALLTLYDLDPSLVQRVYQSNQIHYTLSDVGRQVMVDDLRAAPEPPLAPKIPVTPQKNRIKSVDEERPRSRSSATPRARPCLKCNRPFYSSGPHNRLCPRCARGSHD